MPVPQCTPGGDGLPLGERELQDLLVPVWTWQAAVQRAAQWARRAPRMAQPYSSTGASPLLNDCSYQALTSAIKIY